MQRASDRTAGGQGQPVTAPPAQRGDGRDAAGVLGLSRNTVNRFAAAASAKELLVKATTWPGKFDRYKPYLRQRWNAACGRSVR